jgi:ankyrin repeat protein
MNIYSKQSIAQNFSDIINSDKEFQKKKDEIALLIRNNDEFFSYKDFRGLLPISAAVATQNLELVRWLLDQQGAEEFIDELNYDFSTALYKAVVYGNLDIVKTLIEYGANPQPDPDRLPLSDALRYTPLNNIDSIVNYIEEKKGVDISKFDSDG